MYKNLKQFKRNIINLSKNEIFDNIRNIREQFDFKDDKKKANLFAEILFESLQHLSTHNDFTAEYIILNQLVEVAWWAKKDNQIMNLLSKGISQVLSDSKSTNTFERIRVFSDLIDIIARFPENQQIYSAISTGVIELIKWGKDEEILEILEVIQQKTAMYPLVKVIQLLNVKVFMNTLFYLDDQNCETIHLIYNKLSCVAISNYDEIAINQKCNSHHLIFGEEINEILQEGTINAIINIARRNHQKESNNETCLLGIRKIIQDSEYLLRKKGEEFFQDINRLSYTFDQFDLWGEFLDIPLVAELKRERDKNQIYQIAEAKFLAIQKNMRIEEYDSLKIGRRGIILAYDLNNVDDISQIMFTICNQKKDSLKSINLVDEVDAVISYDMKLKEHLRETGQIPADKITVAELQDQTSLEDDLTKPATKEDNIVNQVTFFKDLARNNDFFLENHILHTKALIFSVAMFGFESLKLNISVEELLTDIENLCERKMVLELIDSLVRAVTLRAARLDGYSTVILLRLLNKIGLKFLNRYYKYYNFIDNLVRLISYLGRQGQTKQLLLVKNELEKANRIILKDNEITIKIARAINEGILAFSSSDINQKLELMYLNKELAKIHSYDINIQLKFIEGLNFLILDFAHFDEKTILKIASEITEFAQLYSKNQIIEEKAALGLLWVICILQIYNMNTKIDFYKRELNRVLMKYPQSEFIFQIKQLSEKALW